MDYNIVVKRHELPFGVGGHLYLEVQTTSGTLITQIHGLATSRLVDPVTLTRQKVTVGDFDDQIMVYDNIITGWSDGA